MPDQSTARALPLSGIDICTTLSKTDALACLQQLVSRERSRKSGYSGEVVGDAFRLFRFKGILYPYTPLFTGRVEDAEDTKQGSVVILNVVPPWLGHGIMAMMMLIYLFAVSPGTLQGVIFGVLLILFIALLMMRFRGHQIQSVFTDLERVLAEPAQGDD